MSIYINNAKWTASDATTPSSILSQPTMGLVDGATYKVYITTTNTVFAASDTYVGVQLGGGDKRTIRANEVWNAAKPLYLVCGTTISAGLEISAVNATALDTMTIDNVSVIVEQMKPSTNLDSVFVTNTQTVNAETDIGPIDEYAANGVYNGQTKYTSVGTHPDGAGGSAETWDLWWDNTTDWIISPAAGTKGSNHWKLTAASPIGTFTVVGDVTGTGEVTCGPTDHSTATGSPGLETDGASESRITLYGDYNMANTDRETQWALVSIIKPLAGNANTDRIISLETADGVGYYWTQTGTGTFNSTWSGTTAIDLDGTASENTVHNIMNISDIAANDSWLTVDGVTVDSQADAATLNAVDPVTIVLGARADADADEYAGVYGPQFYLDLTGVTVNAAYKTALASAINNAAKDSNYNAVTIANAIYNYDNNIAGYYWLLNEAITGNASSYYGLGYNITNDTQADGFYLLTSPTGVTGISLGEGEGGKPFNYYQRMRA